MEQGYSPLIVFLLQTLHILRNVPAEDVFLQYLRVQCLALRIKAGESFLRVGDEDATIARSFERTKDSRAGRRALETNVQVCLEWPGSVLITNGCSHGDLAGGLFHTLVFVRETKLVECSAGDEETGSIGRTPVGEAVVDAIAGELFGTSCSKDEVSLQTGVDYLANNFLVGETDNKTVFGSVTVEGRNGRLVSSEMIIKEVGRTICSSPALPDACAHSLDCDNQSQRNSTGSFGCD